MSTKKLTNSPEAVVANCQTELQKPPLYQVYLLNDDYTPMDFVVEVLMQFFGFGEQIATKIMLEVHHQGKGICGSYTRDVAETKVMQVSEYARNHEHPLLCEMEKI